MRTWEDELEIKLDPTLHDVGTYDIEISVHDGKNGSLEVNLTVVITEGVAPNILNPKNITLMEKDGFETEIVTDYDGNGSLYFDFNEELDFFYIINGILKITPNHGDAGIYEIPVNYGIENGPEGTYSLHLNIIRNLTNVEVRYDLVPLKEEYEVGDLLTVTLYHLYYNGRLPFTIELIENGHTHFKIERNSVSFPLENSSIYLLRIGVADSDYIFGEIEIIVKGKEKDEPPPIILPILVIFGLLIILLIIPAIIIFFITRRKRIYNRSFFVEEEVMPNRRKNTSDGNSLKK